MAGRKATPKLLSWHRLVPVCAMLVTLLVSGVLTLAPATLTRALLYPVSHADLIEEAATRHGVDPLLACAVIQCESGWDEDALSAAGAIGRMQVMPATAESLSALGVVDGDAYDVANLAEPSVNIEYGCACLGYLQEHLDTLEEVVAAYNAGIGSVTRWTAEGGTIPDDIEYAETRAYLERVQASYEGYQHSYPEGITSR